MAVEAYIFDIDDTLLATTRANQRARRRCLESFLKAAGIEPDEHAAELERKLYKVFGWSKLRDIWCALAIELGMERPQTAWLEQAEELFVSTFFENLAALETVAHTLEALRGRGKRLGIISDGDERLQLRKLHETGLDRFFVPEHVVVTIQNDYYGAKPSTANFRRMEKLLGLLPHEMLYAGDKHWDIAAANTAGWTSVRTLQADGDGAGDWPFPPLRVQMPDHEIRTFSELMEIE
jgi:HAD superfamily hydrolase (TIGR01549 family)